MDCLRFILTVDITSLIVTSVKRSILFEATRFCLMQIYPWERWFCWFTSLFSIFGIIAQSWEKLIWVVTVMIVTTRPPLSCQQKLFPNTTLTSGIIVTFHFVIILVCQGCDWCGNAGNIKQLSDWWSWLYCWNRKGFKYIKQRLNILMFQNKFIFLHFDIFKHNINFNEWLYFDPSIRWKHVWQTTGT